MFRSKIDLMKPLARPSRRLVLLTGAGLMAASLSTGAILLTPGAALAANECGPTDANPATPDVIACPNVAYPDGITYTSNGNLTVNLASGITTLGTGANDIGGLKLTAANATDSLTATTITALSTSSSTGTRAPVIVDLATQNGDITLTAGGTIGGVAAVVQYGVRAIASGTGDITITGGGNIQTGAETANAGIVGLLATTNGGDININLNGTATGRNYGLLASTSGAGTLTYSGGASAGSTANTTGIAAMDVTTETGLLTLNLRGVSVGTAQAIGLRTHTGSGGAIINLTGGNVTAGNNNSADSGSTTAAAIELNMAGGLTVITQNQASASNGLGAAGSRLWVHDAIRANGSGEIVFNNLSGRIFGQMEFSAFAGDVTFTNAGQWTVRGPSNFTSGDTLITNEAGGVFIIGSRDPRNSTSFELSSDYTSITFGGGSSTFTNAGAVSTSVTGNSSILHAQTVEFIGLETFNNSGDIILGAANDNPSLGPDTYIDDVLIVHDTNFAASAGSRFLMDIDLGVGGGQQNCDRGPDGRLLAADCIDLGGSTVTGQTLIFLKDRVPGDRGAYIPTGVVLVDISGGTASIDNFALDPTTVNYRDEAGGVIDKGLIAYSLAYDEDTQQLKLFGLPNDSALQVPLILEAADQVWRTASANWFERQGEMRDAQRDNRIGGGVWFRSSVDQTEREVTQSLSGGGNTFVWTNDHQTDSRIVTMGADAIHTGDSNTSLLAGFMVGYAQTQTSFDLSPNTMEMDGINAGAYAGLAVGDFFANALFNASRLEMNADIPGLALAPVGALVSTTIQSMGVQLEAGWRWRMGAFGVEPLVSLNQIRTTAEDMVIAPQDPIRTGLTVSFPEQTSTRGGVGARLSLESGQGDWRLGYNATGRVWSDFDSETSATLRSSGPDASLGNDLGGEFYDLTAGVALSNDGGGISGFLNGGVLVGEGYQNLGVSAGFRYQW